MAYSGWCVEDFVGDVLLPLCLAGCSMTIRAEEIKGKWDEEHSAGIRSQESCEEPAVAVEVQQAGGSVCEADPGEAAG